MPYSRPWTTNRCRWVPVQPKATCNTACRSAIVVSAGISRRRQISGLTLCTTTRSWYTLGRGAGCMVSGMAPILALRTDGPGQAPPTVCPALAQQPAAATLVLNPRPARRRGPFHVTLGSVPITERYLASTGFDGAGSGDPVPTHPDWMVDR